jgi:hypothetical protein
MQQQVQVPTVEQLTAQITQLMLQRAQARDVVEQIEKQLPVFQGQLQLLQAQAQAEAAKAEVIED